MNVPYSVVVCDGNERRYVQEVLDSGWLTTAGKCFEFEQKFAAATGGKFAVAVNSATAALHLALEAIGIGPGDEVVVPTMTFTATAEVVRYLGADPVLVDVEYGTALLTPQQVERVLVERPRVKAVIAVHFGGQAAAIDQLIALCRPRGVRVIEDAAHAFPARYAGRPVGAWGDATCFSFYANKTITTGEGGMLVTDDEALARRARIMRLHGIDRDVWNRFTAPRPTWEYDVVAPGFKYNLPDLAAAVGLAQLERAEELRQNRERVALRYFQGLAGVKAIDLPVVRVPPQDHAWHLFWVVLRPAAPVSRSEFLDALTARHVGFSVHYKPLHRMSYYESRYHLSPEAFPNAERHWQGCVSLPLFPSMSDEQCDYVIETVRRLAGG